MTFTSYCVHQMVLPLTCDGVHLIAAYYSFIDLERIKGWVGLFGWLIADGLVFTHKNTRMDNKSAVGRAQRRESSPVGQRPTFYHCATQPTITHSLTAALDQLRVVASSTSNDPGPRSRQHQQIGQCLLPIAAQPIPPWTTRRALPVSSGRSAGVGFYWQLQCLRSRCVLR